MCFIVFQQYITKKKSVVWILIVQSLLIMHKPMHTNKRMNDKNTQVDTTELKSGWGQS